MYDHQPLVKAPGVMYHSDASDPYGAGYGPSTDFRGNVIQVIRYKGAAATSPSVAESHRYDITGNLVEISGTCCVNTAFIYTVATQFAYPEKIARGALDPSSLACLSNSTACVSQSFVYVFNTGLPLTATDANGLTTRTSYDASLRLQRRTQPQPSPAILASAYVDFAYDDSAMSATATTWTVPTPLCLPPGCKPTLQAEILNQFNGLGVAQRVQNLVDGGLRDAISQQYDAMGRRLSVSQPYQLPQHPSLWTTYTYDSLGRITTIQNPNGIQKSIFL